MQLPSQSSSFLPPPPPYVGRAPPSPPSAMASVVGGGFPTMHHMAPMQLNNNGATAMGFQVQLQQGGAGSGGTGQQQQQQQPSSQQQQQPQQFVFLQPNNSYVPQLQQQQQQQPFMATQQQFSQQSQPSASYVPAHQFFTPTAGVAHSGQQWGTAQQQVMYNPMMFQAAAPMQQQQHQPQQQQQSYQQYPSPGPQQQQYFIMVPPQQAPASGYPLQSANTTAPNGTMWAYNSTQQQQQQQQQAQPQQRGGTSSQQQHQQQLQPVMGGHVFPAPMHNPSGASLTSVGGAMTMHNSGATVPTFVVASNSPQSSLTMYPLTPGGATGTLVMTASPGGQGGLGNPLMMMSAGGLKDIGQMSLHSMTPGSMNQTANSSAVSRPPTDVNTWGYAVVDQYHPSLQRLPVPPSVVARTRGTLSYNNDVQSSSTKPCSSTICLKYVSSNVAPSESCPLEDQCTSFHVDRAYLEAARSVSEPLCCALHNDYFSQEMLYANCAPQMTHQRFTLVLEDRAEVELVASQLSLTVGLDQLTHRGAQASSTRVINLRKQVCRLHYEGKCKWTKDCGHVHLCRELHRFLLAFHFPSLIFLLMAESDGAKILAKVSDVAQPQLLEFIRSKSAIPLVTQLIEARKVAALEALVAAGVALTQDHVDALKDLGVCVSGVGSPLSPTVSLNEKIAPLLKPNGVISAASTNAATTATTTAPSSSHERVTPTATATADADEALVAVQMAEAVISSPTHAAARSFTMPHFSPSASVTSLDRAAVSPGIVGAGMSTSPQKETTSA